MQLKARRGSRRWTLAVAELIVWGLVVAGVALVLIAVPDAQRNAALLPHIVLALVAAALFPFLGRAIERSRLLDWVPALLVTGIVVWGLVRLIDHVPSAYLLLFPTAAAAAVLGGRAPGAASAGVAAVAYIVLTGPDDLLEASIVPLVLVGTTLLTGLLVRELRDHYRAELEEHRLATAVRSRLMAVLDAVDEAIVFSDRLGAVRLINTRAAELLDVDAETGIGMPRVDLLRMIARKTEDPEDFMELFQSLHDDPELELRSQLEQIIPSRRKLRLYSGPARDESGARVGRIDVYTDISESVRRAEENERLYEQARRTAESYLRGLLPEGPPRLPRTSVVAHYIPAAGDRAVCGDFYDFISLADGRLGIMIGDVCGIGPAAASDAALTRFTVRSLAIDTPDSGVLLERVARRVTGQLPIDRFVRVFYAVLDPERATLEYTNAGHAPPIVHRAKTAEVVWLEEGGIPLGLEAEASFKAGRVQLEPGDLMVFYTDGVTEAPRSGHPFGTGRLVDIVRDWGAGSPGELVQAIVRAVEAWTSEGTLRDDIALVVTQVIPDALVGEPVRELVLPNEPSRQSEIRAFVGGFLADLRAPVEVSTEILLAVGEAAANACRHGRRPEGRSEVRVKCALQGHDVVVTVADDGPGFDPATVEEMVPERFGTGGRGVFLMRELTDRLDFDSSSAGTTVTLVRRVLE